MEASAWQLILGTTAGFVTAFLAEPIKTYFSARAERQELRSAMYRELLHLYSGWKGLLDNVEAGRIGPSQFLQNLPHINRTDCYRYAKTRPVVFYSLPDATAIDVVHRNFELVASESLSGPDERLVYARQALCVFEGLVSENELDRSRLLALTSPKTRDQLKAGLAKHAA
jgi:hypothetical protein